MADFSDNRRVYFSSEDLLLDDEGNFQVPEEYSEVEICFVDEINFTGEIIVGENMQVKLEGDFSQARLKIGDGSTVQSSSAFCTFDLGKDSKLFVEGTRVTSEEGTFRSGQPKKRLQINLYDEVKKNQKDRWKALVHSDSESTEKGSGSSRSS